MESRRVWFWGLLLITFAQIAGVAAAVADGTDPADQIVREWGYLDIAMAEAAAVDAIAERVLQDQAAGEEEFWGPALRMRATPEVFQHTLLDNILSQQREVVREALREWIASQHYAAITGAVRQLAKVERLVQQPIPEVDATRARLYARIAARPGWVSGLLRPQPALSRAQRILFDVRATDRSALSQIFMAVSYGDPIAEAGPAFQQALREELLPRMFAGVSESALSAFADSLENERVDEAFHVASRSAAFAVGLRTRELATLIKDSQDSAPKPAPTAATEAEVAAWVAEARSKLFPARGSSDDAGAMALLRMAIQASPDHVEGLTLLGLVTTRRAFRSENMGARVHNFDGSGLAAADSLLERAISLDPNGSEAYVYRGFAKLQMRELDAAETLLRKAQELGSTNTWLAMNLADVQFTKGNREEALRLYTALTTESGVMPMTRQRALLVIADCYSNAETVDSLRPVFERYIASNPQDARALQRYGVLLLWDAGDARGARAVLERIPSDSRNQNQWHLLAEALVAIAGSEHLEPGGQLDTAGRALVVEALGFASDVPSVANRLARSPVLWKGVIALLQSGVRYEDLSPDGRLITIAAMYGNIPFAEALLGHGAQLVGPKAPIQPPLMHAALNKQLEMMAWLIARNGMQGMGDSQIVEVVGRLEYDGSPEAIKARDLLLGKESAD